MTQRTLAQQNPYLEEIKLIHVGQKQAHQTGSSAKASTVLVDVGSSQQTDLLIQKELVLGYIHHAVELFHQNYQIICCYQCQNMGVHMTQICHHKFCCD